MNAMPPKRDRLAESLRHLRKSAGLSQTDLGRRAGIDGSYVSMLEAGTRRPSYRVLDLLAKALGTSIAVLVGGLDPRSKWLDENGDRIRSARGA